MLTTERSQRLRALERRCSNARRRWLLFILLIIATTAKAQRSDALDDVAQHLPFATVYTLKACGATGGAPWKELSIDGLAAYALSAATTYTLKHSIKERRPDHSDRRSFPSGHATLAFAGATVLAHEWGHLSPWVTIGGYGMATLVAADRLRLDRHYLHDVCAGAAIGIAATELTYYIKKKLIKSDDVGLIITGNSVTLSYNM